ncbi:helix-turn-helix domain-containing protein [Patescibacteria group bacterium AH-259-L07]|nr:helix-turn-helix domain-containing protein [Patescibacteria group bacterium AH-259-L07]
MLGKFIYQQRTKQNMTQEYLASELGISRPTYMQIERGGRELTISEAKKLAAIFDMTLADFLQEREEPLPEVKIEKGKKKMAVRKPDIQILFDSIAIFVFLISLVIQLNKFNLLPLLMVDINHSKRTITKCLTSHTRFYDFQMLLCMDNSKIFTNPCRTHGKHVL